MDIKTIMVTAALILGVILIFKDYALRLLSSIKVNVPSVVGNQSNVIVTQATAQPENSSQKPLKDLDSLILALDDKKDQKEIDYLIDTLGPKLIRRGLGK